MPVPITSNPVGVLICSIPMPVKWSYLVGFVAQRLRLFQKSFSARSSRTGALAASGSSTVYVFTTVVKVLCYVSLPLAGASGRGNGEGREQLSPNLAVYVFDAAERLRQTPAAIVLERNPGAPDGKKLEIFPEDTTWAAKVHWSLHEANI